MSHAVADVRARAQAAIDAGDAAGASAIFGEGLASFPNDAALWNSAAGASLRAGNVVEAAERFSRARQLAPQSLDYTINHAIALGRLDRHHQALAVLGEHEAQGGLDLRYCSTRANASRNAGLLAEAAQWYDAGLALNTGHARSLHGRSRVALERAEPDAVSRFDRALQASPGDPELWLGKAQALDAAGRTEDAIAVARALVAQVPQWLEALRLLSQLLLAEGISDFAEPYREAAERVPHDRAIPMAHCAVLAGLDRSAEAAEVAAAAARRFPDEQRLVLLEAAHAGEAGQNERAEALWARLKLATSECTLQESRHRLRIGEPERAAHLLDKFLETDPSGVAGWALRGLAWRLLDDPRSEWLHEQAGLVQLLPLRGADHVLPEAVPLLHALHDGSALPLNQSLRGGTQTRGGLFNRYEPIWREFHSSVLQTLDYYRTNLPPHDADHPLLRHRDSKWSIAGSWSVRLSGGGDHHTSHIHSQGVVSSALYLELPGDSRGGKLELGRPPPDLRLALPPLRIIEPREGHLALFPSTLYHGTTPFSGTHRMTVAFDVGADVGEAP
ncbi:putative 2OG-Fe(II) oxygenase [Pelagerythrobacter sp.]|uniref:putative 2OG-Fe(II) oxygenase n=1 Tax=Pelagerythrobacter sp. TaxID=2800702 RepID=UPI0035AD9644